MSVIGLARLPKDISLDEVLRPIKSIRGQYEPMHYICDKRNQEDRKAYFRLSEKLDPIEVMETINIMHRRSKIRAYIPKNVPDLPAPKKKPEKKPMHKKLLISTDQILKEMTTKFAGLYDLSKSTFHRLLQDIVKIIYKRFHKVVSQADGDVILDSCLRLTKAYRKRHPHFADFQLILSTLHNIQDAEGKPRAQVLESDLTSYTVQSYVVDNIPYDQIQQAYNKYLEKITTTVSDHIKNLDMTPNNTSPEEIARIKIREQLKTLLPYLPTCVKHATDQHFIPQESNFYTVHIYGEPALPGREAFNQFLKRHNLTTVNRSPIMYNMITLIVPKNQYLPLLHDDSTLVGTAKLVIRPSNLPKFIIPAAVKKSMRAAVANSTTDDNEQDWSEQTYY